MSEELDVIISIVLIAASVLMFWFMSGGQS